MTKSIRFFFLLALALPMQLFGSAPDTIRLQADKKIDIVQSGIVFASSDQLNPEQAWLLLLQEKRHPQKATIGFTDKIYWIALTAKNILGRETEKILEIDNPHIDRLSFFEMNAEGTATLLEETGDKLIFSSRSFVHRNFALRLSFNPGETRTILIKIDKRMSSLSFPTYLWDEDSFHQKYLSQNLWFGLFFGILTLCLCYALMIFIFLRKSLYGWYFLMTFTSAASLFSLFGYSFQYVYPNLLDFNGYFRAYIQAAFYVCMVKFSQQYLNLPVYRPLVNRILNYILIFIGAWAAVIPFAPEFMIRNNLWMAPLSYSIYFTGFVLFMVGAISTYKKQQITVSIYFVAWGALLIAYVIWMASSLGFIPVEKLQVNPVLIGSSLEVFIFSIGLTYQISKVYNERNQLSFALARQQKELLKAFIDGTEKERLRISRELNDDIGRRLAGLKEYTTRDDRSNAILEKQIDILCADVNVMSTQLAPAQTHFAGLHQMIHQFMEDTGRFHHIKTEVRFYDVPTTLSPEITHHLFRIVQEAVANSLKHAHPTELDLQFFTQDDNLVMTIEDNGRGFDATRKSRGIGLQNMKTRAESLHGTLEISSNPQTGTNIMLVVPVPKVA